MPNESRFLQLVESPSQTPLAQCYEMFMLHQEASRHTPRTIQTYEQRLSPFLDYLAESDIEAPADITPHVIRQFIVRLEQRDLADITILGHTRCIQTFCNFMVDEGLIDVNPMDRVAMPKVEKKIHPPFTTDDIKALLEACEQGRYKLRDRAMVLCLLDTGLRVSEFAAG